LALITSPRLRVLLADHLVAPQHQVAFRAHSVPKMVLALSARLVVAVSLNRFIAANGASSGAFLSGERRAQSADPDLRFTQADGGDGRVCRGDTETDNADAYYVVHDGVASLDACKQLCVASATACKGVEYWNGNGRCEVWTRDIGITAGPVPGFECWRFVASSVGGGFEEADLGANLVCRGAHNTDTSDSYYTLHNGVSSLEDCKALCTSAACTGVEFWNGVGRCEVWSVPIGVKASSNGFVCLRRATTTAATAAVPPKFVEQEGAQIPVSGEIKLYVVGSSNAPWQTWPDQLHLKLQRLGHSMPVIQAAHPDARSHPVSVPICDDNDDFKDLETPRIGKVGWSSWGFSYESKNDCNDAGFRDILGHQVSCTNAWACNPNWCCGVGGQSYVKPSDIAIDASQSQVTVLSNWINDSKQRYAHNVCYNGEAISAVNTTAITVDSLKKVIRAIHALNSNVIIAVLAMYPEASGRYVVESTLQSQAAINQAVRAGLAAEPNTIFVDYTFPVGENVFQELHPGHANCRGDKVLASAVVEALFNEKVISRGLALGDSETCLGASDCSSLTQACCQRSALCRLTTNEVCVDYAPGVQ